MYCGVNLLNLNRNRRHIDHVIPVEHGGRNEESNYQALCNRCNSRKGGHQTDEEFRQRYQGALGSTQPGTPPRTRIPYSRFEEITRRTSQLEPTVARRKAVFKTPSQKIAAANAVASAVLAAAWFLSIPLTFSGSQTSGTVAFVGAPVVFATTWIGLMWRAKISGILHED